MFYVLGWDRLAASPPTDPIPYKENVILCHSERSEESTVFYRTILIENYKSMSNKDKYFRQKHVSLHSEFEIKINT